MTLITTYRVFSVVDGYTVMTVDTAAEAEAMCEANEEYDWEEISDYW